MFRKYKEEIQALKDQIDKLSRENEHVRKENDDLMAKLRGDRVSDFYCRKCENWVSDGWDNGCILNCKCKDFSLKADQGGKRKNV